LSVSFRVIPWPIKNWSIDWEKKRESSENG